MAIIDKTVVVPMLRVECSPALGSKTPLDGWPEYVQVLPPIGSYMDNCKHPLRARVDGYVFFCDGTIRIQLAQLN